MVSALLLGGGWGLGCKERGPTAREVLPGSPLRVEWSTPAGFLLNDQAPSSIELRKGQSNDSGAPLAQWGLVELKRGPVELSIEPGLSGQELVLEGRFYLCQKEQTKICTLIRKRELLRVSERSTPQKSVNSLFWNLEPELGGKRLSE